MVSKSIKYFFKHRQLISPNAYVICKKNFISSKKDKLYGRSVFNSFFFLERNSVLLLQGMITFKHINKLKDRLRNKNVSIISSKRLISFKKHKNIMSFVIYKIIATLKRLQVALTFKKFGVKSKISVTGYSRKMWLSKNKRLLRLKIGKSSINTVAIPYNVKVKLIRKRILTLYSSSKRALFSVSNTIWQLRKADDYRGEGIRWSFKPLRLKDRLTKKK